MTLFWIVLAIVFVWIVWGGAEAAAYRQGREDAERERRANDIIDKDVENERRWRDRLNQPPDFPHTGWVPPDEDHHNRW